MSDPPRIVRPSIPGGLPKSQLIALAVLSVPILLVALGAVFWVIIRVEVNANQILVLVNKTGRTLPPKLAPKYGDQVVLYPELVAEISALTGETLEEVRTGYKGIRYEVLLEGRYFPNPYAYKAVKLPATVIGQNEVGALIRRFGKPLPFPKTVATEPDERGPVREILRPGRHNVNLLAFEVLKLPALEIPEGHAGVVTLLSGTDPKVRNTYTVGPGEKGVQARALPPGLEYYNPFLKRIEIVDVRSHKYDMLGAGAIRFPSNDSFTITVEGTIEWAIRPDKVAEVSVEYGNEEDILKKIILPNARSIARIQGSKLLARDFISGKTRTVFQDHLLAELKRECSGQGIEIKSALVRDIQVPTEIAALISQREQADQEIDRYTNEMEEAKAEVRLVEQQVLLTRNSELGEARRKVVSLIKDAEQRKVVQVTNANRRLEVAKLDLEAAKKQASAVRARGQARANVVLFDYKAEAEPLAAAVKAFGGGSNYAQQFFLKRVAPSIRSILSNTEGPFSKIFEEFQTFTPSSSKGGE